MIYLAVLQVVRDIVAIFGVIAGLTYYVMTVRNQSKARQIQLISQLSSYTSEEFQKREGHLFTLEWEDYDEFEKKYGSGDNMESAAQRYAVWSDYNKTGLILKTGLIDVETFLGFTGGQIGLVWQWHKFESVIKEQRRRYKMPDLFVWWEYAAAEIRRYYDLKGHADIIPEHYSSYVPEA